MTEIHCPACSALLNLDISVPGLDSRRFASAPVEASPPVSDSAPRAESERTAKFNAALADALRDFVRVHPWEGHRLPGDIQADFVSWCRGAPDGSPLRQFLIPVPVTKNRISKLLVSELGATFYKGPGGRLYRLPEEYQPAGADVPEGSVEELGPAAGVDLAGSGSLELSGVASLPLAEHVAAVRAQAAAEDAVLPPSPDEAVRNLVTGLGAVHQGTVDYVFVVKDGVRHKVPVKRPDAEVVTVQEPDYELPEGTVLDGPSVFPVEAGPAPSAAAGLWRVYLTDAEAELPPEGLEMLASERLPDRVVLAGAPDLAFDDEGTPYAVCPVHSVDGAPAGTGEVRVPLPWLKGDDGAREMWVEPDVGEAAAAPLPSPEQLAAAAGHDALERARARSAAAAAPVFLATEDYQGADPGDWG